MNAFSFPNILSAARLAAAPLLAAVFWLPRWTDAPQAAADVAAAAVFAAAALTDFADGYWARRHRQQTPLGAFLDPLADKILVATALLLLVDAGSAPTAAVLLIVAREIFVSALREWAALAGTSGAVRVSAAGKWKTAMQMIAAPLLFLGGALWNPHLAEIGAVLLWAAAALAVWSMAEYCRAAWRTRGFHGRE